MRNLLLLLLLFVFFQGAAQVPQQINYQGVARNSVGSVLSNQNISLRLSVREGAASGPYVYRETRTLKTNNFGLFVTAIGSPGATNVSGSFNSIDWGGSVKFLQVEIDPAGAAGFIDMGTSQLLSVPYAIYAGAASPVGNAGGDLTGNFPSPQLRDNSVSQTKILNGAVSTQKLADSSITANKLAPGVIPTSIPISGVAGGDLSGNYPNPVVANSTINSSKLADNAVITAKIADGSVTANKLAAGVIPTSIPVSGTAGGDLSGTYPNPTITSGAVNSTKIADNAIVTSKILDGSVTASKLAPGVIPTSIPISGVAGGDLSGTYPNPLVNNGAITENKLADNAVGTAKIVDGSVTASKLAPGVIPTSIPVSGTAAGDLTGTYPNPSIANNVITSSKLADGAITNIKIADDAVSTIKVQDGSITAAKLAPGLILGGGGPTGSAGGDLSGNYPNPSIASGAVTGPKIANGAVITPKIADGAVNKNKLADLSVGTEKIIDGSVTYEKLAPGVIPTSIPISGVAGGDLSGNYPNPVVANSTINSSKLADNAVITAKIADGSVTANKLAAGVIPTSIPVSGTAGGDLSGTYPNPTITGGAVNSTKIADNAIVTSKILDGSVTASKLAPGVIPTSIPVSGTAGGDLSGTYPNPTITSGAVNSTKIADNAIVTSKILDGSVTASKLAPGVIPTSIPVSGTAGGDLSGTYPNPVVTKLTGIALSSTTPTVGQVLKYDGAQWLPSTDNSGSFALPFSQTVNVATTAFNIVNQNTTASAITGENTSNGTTAVGLLGKITLADPGLNSAAVKGVNNATNSNGVGVWGHHAGYGKGVYGFANDGTGISGESQTGSGVFGTSTEGAAGYFDISNSLNGSDALFVSTSGSGNALTAISTISNGVLGIANDLSGAGLFGANNAGGEGVVGRTISNIASGVIGRNDGTYAGVKGVNTADSGTAILATANANGAVNGTALIAELQGSGNGNTAVFKANGANVARIDKTGKGFFNGGTQVGGADVAEFFDVEGNLKQYEPGDVLVISQNSDRKVERSAGAYSTLVAGVYATKPGLMLTEENAEKDALENMVPMGVVGVIPTKVCLEGGIIKRGDLIVTSSLSGVAMKADPDKVKIGQVIGKALQDFTGNGVGKINILVSIK